MAGLAVLASASPNCCLAATRDGVQCVVTGGSDGEVAVHEVRDAALATTVHKRIHRGAISAIVPVDASGGAEKCATVGEDGTLHVVAHSEGALTGRLVYRSTLPLRALAHRADGLFACTGGELKVVVVKEEDGSVVWTSETLKNPVVALAWLSGGDLLGVDCEGTVTLWDGSGGGGDGGAFSARSTRDLMASLSKQCQIALLDTSILICCADNGLFILANDARLGLVDHIKLPLATQFHMAVVGGRVVLAHSKGLTVVSIGTDIDISPEIAVGVSNVIGIAGSPPKSSSSSLFAISADGNLTLLAVDLPGERPDAPGKERASGASTPVKSRATTTKKASLLDEILDSEEDAAGSADAMEHDELDDYSVDDEMSVDGPDGIQDETSPTATHAALPECIHRPFQPGSTTSERYRFLAWNTVGLIASRIDEGYNSVEVEFHDRAFHRPIRIMDDAKYTMGSVGRTAVIFAGERKVHVVPLDGIDRAQPFVMELSAEEEVLGVAAGGAKYVAFVTSAGYVRLVTPNNLQGPILNHPGKFVAAAANGKLLLVVHADEFSSELSYSLYDLDRVALVRCGSVGGRFRNTRATWIGLSDAGIAGVFDESMTLHILNPDSGTWQAWLECSEQRERGEAVWPIAFTSQDLLCVVHRRSEAVEPVPRPNQTMLAMRWPLVGIDETQVSLYEKAFRTGLVLGGALRPEISEKEARRLALAMDKHVLELVRLTVRADRPARVLELCTLFQLEKSWDIAVQLVRHERMASLAERIESFKDKRTAAARDCGTVERGEDVVVVVDKSAILMDRLRTPRQLKRIASESPSTALVNMANGTPVAGGGEEHFGTHQALSPLATTTAVSPMPLQRSVSPAIMPSDHQHDALSGKPAGLTRPFEQLSVDEQAERKTKNFVELIKSVHAVAESHEPAPQKRVKTADGEGAPVAAAKAKKQSDLSMFARRPAEQADAENAGNINRMNDG